MCCGRELGIKFTCNEPKRALPYYGARYGERVQAVADLFHHYAHMPANERAKLPITAPIVHILYYHSKEGAKNLAHLAEVAPEAGWTLRVH